MKQEQREVWLRLSNMPNKFVSGLCCWYRFAEFEGGSCEDVDFECKHPIDKVADQSYDAWSGSDCWAFRPLFQFDSFVDAIGLCLQGIYPNYNSLEKHTKLKV